MKKPLFRRVSQSTATKTYIIPGTDNYPLTDGKRQALIERAIDHHKTAFIEQVLGTQFEASIQADATQDALSEIERILSSLGEVVNGKAE